jgi:hypothetical protein
LRKLTFTFSFTLRPKRMILTLSELSSLIMQWQGYWGLSLMNKRSSRTSFSLTVLVLWHNCWLRYAFIYSVNKYLLILRRP